MATLRQWAEEHMEEVEQALQAYEEKETAPIREGKTTPGERIDPANSSA